MDIKVVVNSVNTEQRLYFVKPIRNVKLAQGERLYYEFYDNKELKGVGKPYIVFDDLGVYKISVYEKNSTQVTTSLTFKALGPARGRIQEEKIDDILVYSWIFHHVFGHAQGAIENQFMCYWENTHPTDSATVNLEAATLIFTRI